MVVILGGHVRGSPPALDVLVVHLDTLRIARHARRGLCAGYAQGYEYQAAPCLPRPVRRLGIGLRASGRASLPRQIPQPSGSWAAR